MWMSISSAEKQPGIDTQMQGASDTRLRGRWLLIARMGWVAVAAFTLVLFVASLPVFFTQLQTFCTGIPCPSRELFPSSARALQDATGLSLAGYATLSTVLGALASLVWIAVGLFIFLRRSDDWMALLVGLLCVASSLSGPNDLSNALAQSHSLWQFPARAEAIFQLVLGFLFFALFPNGRFTPRWMRWVVLLFSVIELFGNIFASGSSFLGNMLFFIFALSIMAGQVYRYVRVSTPLERQQTKWVVFSILTVLILQPVLFTPLELIYPSLQQSGSLYQAITNMVSSYLLLVVPVSIAIAILRYRLWDIDALINKALVYGLLTGLLGALYTGLIIGLESLVGAITGQNGQQPVVLVISTLAIAALFQPLRKRIQSSIDRRFYRRKYDAEKTLAAFSATLRNEVELNQLRDHLLTVVEETIQPAHVSLWLRQPEPQDRL